MKINGNIITKKDFFMIGLGVLQAVTIYLVISVMQKPFEYGRMIDDLRLKYTIIETKQCSYDEAQKEMKNDIKQIQDDIKKILIILTEKKDR